MLKKESIFKVTRIHCRGQFDFTSHEFVKARNSDHALRIANRLFSDVVSVEFTCEDNFN